LRILSEIQEKIDNGELILPEYWREGDTLRHIYAFNFDTEVIEDVKTVLIKFLEYQKFSQFLWRNYQEKNEQINFRFHRKN